MYCPNCGKLVPDNALFCGSCGKPTNGNAKTFVNIERRPIAGIIVGGILGVLMLIMSVIEVFSFINGSPEWEGGFQESTALFSTIVFCAGLAFIMVAIVLLIGVLLAFLRHANGPKMVRIISYCMIGFALLSFAGILLAMAMRGGEAWKKIDELNLIGVIIINLFEWGLLLFLFRKSRWP